MNRTHLSSATLDQTGDHDALCVVYPVPLERQLEMLGLPKAVEGAVRAALAADEALARGKRGPSLIACEGAPGGRVILAPAGVLEDETADVRLYAEATNAAMQRAVEAGARRPLLHVLAPKDGRFERAREVSASAALGSQWIPLEAREAEVPTEAAERVGVTGLDDASRAQMAALEVGRALCRDLTGTEPERMAPLGAASLCEKAFAGAPVKITVETNVSRYPLLAAVARASQAVARHAPCVVRLEYAPKGPIGRTLFIAGKGVTYDTGGADLKTEGRMAGMSRDKGGAGAAAGFVRTIAELAPAHVRVVALLGLVRNSIGEEAYVSDEIIKSRGGKRVRIGNTDAEGRLVLADLLAALREEALRDGTGGAPNPMFVSIATLTGHAYRAYGPYTAIIGNAAAKDTIAALAAHGEAWGEPYEVSRVRREDYALVAAKSAAEDVVSANRLASVNTPRGHQYPFAFLDIASGLKGDPAPFIHLDIAGTAVEGADWQFGRPSGVPILSLTAFAGG